MDNNLPNIFFFPNNVTVYSYNYTQDEFDSMNKLEKQRFKLTVFPLLKHRWKFAYVVQKGNIIKLNKETNSKSFKKIELNSINLPIYVDNKNKQFKIDNKLISFECYSFIKCKQGVNVDTFDDYILKGLIEGGNAMKIFSNSVGNIESSKEIFGNTLPFAKIPLASLLPKAQVEIFSAWMSHNPVVLTGGTGVGKTSQVPKLLLWFNYLFGGFSTLLKISPFEEREIVLSLPRITLVKLHSNTLLNSLGFKHINGSPINLKFGAITNDIINHKPKSYGIIFATHKLTLTKLFNYGTVIIDEVHEHDQIGDIIIAISRKHISKLDSLFLMTATLEDDRSRLQNFLPNPIFVHIPGDTLYKISEVYIKNKIDFRDKNKYLEEELKNLVTAIKKYTPKPKYSGIVFVATIAQCETYKIYLQSHLPYNIYIIHGKVNDIDKILNEVYTTFNVSIIVSTPYLESSVTIKNVTHIYDMGRVFIPAPLGGKQIFISKSMRDQRKGRVGRVMPGTYLYFYDINNMKTINRIDSEYLHNYVLYAKQFNLTLPKDLFIIPSDLSLLYRTQEYIENFNISDKMWSKILSSYYLKMVEYAKIYSKGGENAIALDNFERDDIMNDTVYNSIISLDLKAKVLKIRKQKNMYLHTCKLLFGPFYGKIFNIQFKKPLNEYILMITEHMFIPYLKIV
ncbi:RNA-helicase, DExH-NPH-II [Eptesipox virus]|uniref:RNA helicase NPH-II n=1 Tax=Eptesipox virus TaxID=1329402 RepID=A0A220T6B4_9POXV|nr:RNA-helicase, DExH-NPH-II [Eptesipox virus]ASK51254.1 RNA-helicase, DExH-NPH-II [Eptesipox virus]WAH71012.1 RNA-helicase, DExH-NPH-II [Eptesipox virus]